MLISCRLTPFSTALHTTAKQTRRRFISWDPNILYYPTICSCAGSKFSRFVPEEIQEMIGSLSLNHCLGFCPEFAGYV